MYHRMAKKAMRTAMHARATAWGSCTWIARTLILDVYAGGTTLKARWICVLGWGVYRYTAIADMEALYRKRGLSL